MNMEAIGTILLAAGIVFSPAPLHAQTDLVGSLNNDLAPVQPAVPDSVVQITAEMQGLQAVAYSDLPTFGTYWEVMPGGGMAPLPAPVFDPSLPIYAIAGNIYLVDASYGQLPVNPRQTSILSASSATSATAAAVQTEATAVANLIDQVQAASAAQAVQATAMDSGLSSPPGFDDTSTYSYTPEFATNDLAAVGTNLWIIQPAVAFGYLTGVGTNTQPVQYEIQSRTNLAQSDWQSEGFIPGSDLTNWTPLSIAQNGRTNLFIRLKSWGSSDGSGLPDWWELQYFGTNGIDADALDSVGDGYTIYQKYLLGVAPNSWFAPAAPQGLSAALNLANKTALVSWVPSPAATGYTLEKTDSNPYPPTVQNIPLSASTTSYTDNLSGNDTDPYNGNNYDVSYQIMANYTGGHTSPWSGSIPLQQITVTASIMPGASGVTALAVSGVPPNAAAVQLVYIDIFDTSQDYNKDIPVSSFTNGVYYMATTSFVPTNGDVYYLYAESVDASGNPSGANLFDELSEPNSDYNAGTPFYDGRVQLKQNLIFQLRAAAVDAPFHFNTYSYPSNCASASLYDFANSEDFYGAFDTFLPFEENNLFRNFVFNITNVDSSGALTTGVSGGGSPPDYYNLDNPTFQFNSSLPVYQALLATNQAKWFLYDQSTASDDMGSEGIVSSTTDGSGNVTVSMASGKYNWFGLPYTSINIVVPNGSGGLATNVVSAGHSSASGEYSSIPANIYVQTAQPGFRTTNYDFWVQNSEFNHTAPLPGNAAFSPTNQSQLLITPVADSYFQIAGYAKLAVTNSIYSGVYGYLGQYFTNAYMVDTNANVTTNKTGILSPYGNFFATHPGPVALVTMPDPDTGAQGTGIVHCISLNVDKNHDGTIDTSFNGPDVTSQTSPMEFWINNDNDGTGVGADIDAPKLPDSTNEVIQSMRDLEDFARLWICGVPSGDALESYQVTLSFQNCVGNPSIKLFASHEADGGYGYLTNTNIAQEYVGSPMNDSSLGMVSASTNYVFPYLRFYNGGTQCLLFEGVSTGEGELVLTITDSNSNRVAQTGVWLDLHQITDFYEKAEATNVSSTVPPSSLVSQYNVIHAGLGMGNETKQVIVYVHGINRPAWGAQNEGETLFKRLYWSGYQGHFAEFRWPCAYLPPNSWWPYTFNESEFWAYKSAPAFKNYLGYLKNRQDLAGYAIDILAHSQGNAVVSEALSEGAAFNNCILTQGAVPAQCYDGSAPTLPVLMAAEASTPTPFAASIGGYNQCWTNISGNMVNFFNVNDFALATGSYGPFDANWVKNQQSQKPEAFVGGPSYIYYPSNQTSVAYYTFGSHYTVTDWEESRSMVARSRTSAIGAQGPATGQTTQGIIGGSVDLFGEFGFGNTRPEHSAQFTRPIQTVWGYYDQILRSFQILPINRQ